MRDAFAHEATLLLDRDADRRAPGAAVTLALCGRWEHPPPCPLAPHWSHATWVDGDLHLRVLFATAPGMEAAVRARITAALRRGHLRGPDGALTVWRLRSSQRSAVRPGEATHAHRLVHS